MKTINKKKLAKICVAGAGIYLIATAGRCIATYDIAKQLYGQDVTGYQFFTTVLPGIGMYVSKGVD